MAAIITSIIVAVSSNGVIGRDGDMPWRLSTDLKRFKALTLGKPVIMGRKTFQSIGKPLPGRANIVITRDAAFHADGVHVVASLAAAVDMASVIAVESGVDEICITGGGEIYRQALDRADIMHVTHVQTEVAGDTHFPPIDPGVWQAIDEQDFPAGEKDNYPTHFVTYRRKSAAN